MHRHLPYDAFSCELHAERQSLFLGIDEPHIIATLRCDLGNDFLFPSSIRVRDNLIP